MPQRFARGGEVLAPGRPDDPVQFIDVRDLAEFMVHLLEHSRSGVHNAVGPQAMMTMPQFLEQAAEQLHSTLNGGKIHLGRRLRFPFKKHKIEEAIPWADAEG